MNCNKVLAEAEGKNLLPGLSQFLGAASILGSWSLPSIFPSASLLPLIPSSYLPLSEIPTSYLEGPCHYTGLTQTV